MAGLKQLNNGDGLVFFNRKGELEGFRVNRVEANRVFPLDMPQLAPKTPLYRNFDQVIDRVMVGVAGTFSSYAGFRRKGFLILDMDGTAQQKFNVPGVFNGQLYQVQESQTTVGSYGLLLMGKFTRFNSKVVHNMLMLELDLDH